MRELMSPPIPFPSPHHIKSKILLQAVRLFALKGYHDVSVREIADAACLRPTVVFHHFPSKLSVMESIMHSAKEDILSFYGMLDRLSNEADSFSQIISNIFVESTMVVNPSAFHAIYCAMINQFSLECCRHVYYDIYFMEGHLVMRRQLDTAIRRGLAEPFDVAEVAATITNCFVTMIPLNVGQINGFYKDFNATAWYERQINHVLHIAGALDA